MSKRAVWRLEESDGRDILHIEDAQVGLALAREMLALGLDPEDFSMDYRTRSNWIRWNRHLTPEETQIVSEAIARLPPPTGEAPAGSRT